MNESESPSPGSADLADLSLRGRGGKGHLIIIGASARAAAQSAIRAGYSPWCIDLFADRDLQAIAPVKRCPREKWPQGILELMRDAPPGPVLFTGAMENHVSVLKEVERLRPLFGSGGMAVETARNLAIRDAVCEAAEESLQDDRGAALSGEPCDVHGFVDMPYIGGPASNSHWPRRPWFASLLGLFGWRCLVKPYRSAGGRGIRRWRRGESVRPGEYVAEYIEGTPFSAVFHADERGCSMLGASEQIVGDAVFGAAEFSYVGNLVPCAVPRLVLIQLDRFGRLMWKRAGLRGLFGVDAMAYGLAQKSKALADANCAVVLEVNPRYVASVELHERAFGGAFLRGDPGNAESADGPRSHLGKAIIHAKFDCRTPDLYGQFDRNDIADVPEIDAPFRRGEPICTVFARGDTRDACYAGLREMAEQIYTRLEPA